MLSRVVIKNFKSIGEPGVDLELKPLTLLVGPNGGGKSSILEAIGVVTQDSPSGRLVDFQSWESVIHQPANSTATVDVYLSQNGTIFASLGFRREVTPRGLKGKHLEAFDRVTSNPDVLNLINDLLKKSLFAKTFLISSVRGAVPYATDTSGYPEWVGPQGAGLLLLLARIFSRREYDNIAGTIAGWASRFGVQGLKAGLWGSDTAGSDYVDSELKVTLNLALSSSGARQILTVITQLFWAPEGSLVMIEEPEISLHPQAQIEVLEMFAEAIKENKQIIATTHSHFLLQAIGYAVHKEWLVPDQIAVYHIEKTKEGTKADKLPLDESGYIEGWIPSFTQIERQLLLEWADTLPRE